MCFLLVMVFFRLYARYVRWVVQAVHRNIYTRRYRCRDGIRALAARLEGVILLDDVRRILAEEFDAILPECGVRLGIVGDDLSTYHVVPIQIESKCLGGIKPTQAPLDPEALTCVKLAAT